MKLLLTADLHFRIHWFRWLIEQATGFDLVCIAGDLLDMFKSETGLEQAREVRTLIRELADIVPVAVCSGNHDNAGRLVSHDRASLYEWFVDLGTHPNIITDGSTRKLENLIVTTVPYHCSRQEKSIWLDSRFHDSQTNRRCRGSFFITFRPKLGGVPAERNLEAAELLAAYRPDYFVSGHDHAFPYTSGQSWKQKLDEVSLLVPGQLLRAPIPNYITLDTESGEISWHTASETILLETGTSRFGRNIRLHSGSSGS